MYIYFCTASAFGRNKTMKTLWDLYEMKKSHKMMMNYFHLIIHDLMDHIQSPLSSKTNERYLL